MEFQNTYDHGGITPKPQERLLAFSYTLRRAVPFGNEMQFSKYPGWLRQACNYIKSKMKMIREMVERVRKNNFSLFPFRESCQIFL